MVYSRDVIFDENAFPGLSLLNHGPRIPDVSLAPSYASQPLQPLSGSEAPGSEGVDDDSELETPEAHLPDGPEQPAPAQAAPAPAPAPAQQAAPAPAPVPPPPAPPAKRAAPEDSDSDEAPAPKRQSTRVRGPPPSRGVAPPAAPRAAPRGDRAPAGKLRVPSPEPPPPPPPRSPSPGPSAHIEEIEEIDIDEPLPAEDVEMDDEYDPLDFLSARFAGCEEDIVEVVCKVAADDGDPSTYYQAMKRSDAAL